MPIAEQQDRERQHHVDRAREQRVDPAAVVAGDQADDDADEHAMRGRDDRHLERHARAVDVAREHVAAEVVDAERVRRRSGPVGVPNVVERLGVLARSGRGAPTSLTISGAKIATRTRRTITPSAASATLSLPSRRQKSCHGERAAISPGRRRAGGATEAPAPPSGASGVLATSVLMSAPGSAV